MIHPITFSIPEDKIVKGIPKKTNVVSKLIPGLVETYIYQDETDYYNQYKESMFAKTTKKSGWDCMRHYEILASGCIPYFPDIENCPVNTMALLPKTIIMEGNALYKKYGMYKSIDEFKTNEINECFILISKLLHYTSKNLTTKQMAKYILDKTNFNNASSVLYLSGSTGPDYLRCLTLHGFKELLGDKCHDYPKIPHVYKTENINYKDLYGKGITYTNALDSRLHNDAFDETVENDIKNKKFDIIIYGSYHRGMPFYDLVNGIYEPNEIILLCGEDIHRCNYNELLYRGHNVFVREL